MTQSETIRARRAPKQLRSRRMVAKILGAAARVFAEVGFEAATTNRVAQEAGVSVGSLYQFFPNKAALLLALRAEWLGRVHATIGEALRPERARPLEDIIDAVIQAFETLDAHQPGLLQALTNCPTCPAWDHETIDLAITGQVEVLLALRAPRLAPERRAFAAGVCVHLTDALFGVPNPDKNGFHPGVAREVKAMLLAYLRELGVE